MQQHAHHLAMASRSGDVQRRRARSIRTREVCLPLGFDDLARRIERSRLIATAAREVQWRLTEVVRLARVRAVLKQQPNSGCVTARGRQVQRALLRVRLRLERRTRQPHLRVQAQKKENRLGVARVRRMVERREAEAITRGRACARFEQRAQRRDDRLGPIRLGDRCGASKGDLGRPRVDLGLRVSECSHVQRRAEGAIARLRVGAALE